MTLREIVSALLLRRSKIDAVIASFSALDPEDQAIEIHAVATAPKPGTKPKAGRQAGRQAGKPQQPPRRTTDGAKCSKHPDAEPAANGRCRLCQRDYNRAYAAKKQKGSAAVRSSESKPLQASPGRESGAAFSTIADAHARKPEVIKIPCDACGEKFIDAKSMGIHKTRVHFNSENGGRRSTLNG